MTQSEKAAAAVGNDTTTLRHGYASLWSVTVLGLSAQQIGPGVALAGGYMYVYAGAASWLSMLIALAAACALGAAVVVFSRRQVATGGLMSYAGKALGPHARALCGAGYVGGILIGVAGVVTGVVVFTSSFFVQIGVAWAASSTAQVLSAVILAALAAALAYRGLDASVRVSAVLSFVGIPFVIWVTIAAALNVDYNFAAQFDFSSDALSFDTILQGTLVASAYFVGYEGLSAMAGETRDPKRNVPRLIALLVGITGVSYIVILWAQIPSLAGGVDMLNAGDSPTAVLAHLGNVPFLAAPLDLLMAAATFAGLVAAFNYASRIVATAAADGLLPRRLAHIDARYRSPSTAVLFMAIFAAGVPLVLQLVASAPPLESSIYLYTLFAYFYLIPYVLAAIAAITVLVRERTPNPLVIGFIAAGGAAWGYVLWYALAHAGESGAVFGALPWINLGLTAVTFAAFVIAYRRNPAKESAIEDLL
jgi:amino acid transporter